MEKGWRRGRHHDGVWVGKVDVGEDRGGVGWEKVSRTPYTSPLQAQGL